MKSILLIGLGRFGKFIAMKLHTMGHQVMEVDTSEERVNAMLPYVTNAQIGDSTNEEFLASLGIGNYDSCIVAIGDNFQNSLETAYLLKELGAKKFGINILCIRENGILNMSITPDTVLGRNKSILVLGQEKAVHKCLCI